MNNEKKYDNKNDVKKETEKFMNAFETASLESAYRGIMKSDAAFTRDNAQVLNQRIKTRFESSYKR